MEDQPTATAGEALTFSQTIKPSTFIGLSLKNGLLNLVTLTLYRFWAKTAVRRRVWTGVRLNDEPFEYTGTGGELFLGFLRALLILGLPYLLVILAAQFVSPLFAILFLPAYIGLFVLIGAAIFLTYRYIASRTVWRGVRLHLKGSPVGYGWAFLGYSLLTGITLGWFAPAMSMRLAERLWHGLSFGDQKFRWVRAKEEGLYGKFAIAWLVGILGYFGLVGSLVPALLTVADSGAQPDVAFMTQMFVSLLVLALVVVVASMAYQAALLRETARSIRLGDARFLLQVKTMDLLVLILTNILILVFSLGFLSAVVTARTARFVIARLSSTGEESLSAALQAPRGPATGEGMADALDISVF
jgi:uncharacterized membrane protein YjgN (DUF898 family)